MGTYLNPGNAGFLGICKDDYVDKTGLIAFVNETIDKPSKKMLCVSRPRRFGKTIAAKMLCAYYSRDCDSHALFEKLKISKFSSFEKHLNQYNVIYLDITWFISQMTNLDRAVLDIQEWVIQELREEYPGCIAENTATLPKALAEIYNNTRERFYFIIDEWDALFREAKKNIEIQREYIQLLRGLFKGGTSTDNTIVGAYMTGILPIKKYGTESALTDFSEYTMVEPDMLATYVGFTEKEVQELCEKHQVDFEKMKLWYDGYSFSDTQSVYSPNSVMQAISRKRYRSYWSKTGTYESLKEYISENKDGLKDAIILMLGGMRIEIDTSSFQNDFVNLNSRDDVLTLLVHLGYLAYDDEISEVWIPNLEVMEVFKTAIKNNSWTEIWDMLDKSNKLLKETIAGNADYVALALEEYHQQNTSILKYNDENSLSCVLTIAYYTARSEYQIIREFPTGKGFADLAFIPRKHSDKPAIIIELKYDKSAKTALQQIKDKDYAGAFKEYEGNMLLVGVNYDEKKGHSCVIERYTKNNQ